MKTQMVRCVAAFKDDVGGSICIKCCQEAFERPPNNDLSRQKHEIDLQKTVAVCIGPYITE